MEVEIGFWADSIELATKKQPFPIPNRATFPGLKKFMGKLQHIQENEAVIYKSYKQPLLCKLCEEYVVKCEYRVNLRNKIYTWPSSLIHYYEEHSIHPDKHFYNDVMAAVLQSQQPPRQNMKRVKHQRRQARHYKTTPSWS